VVSAVTGKNTDECAQLFREISGRRNITGTSNWEMCKVLSSVGIRTMIYGIYDYLPVQERPTFTQWLKKHKKLRTHGRVWLLVSGNHWQLVSGRQAVCALTEDVVSIRDKRLRRRARVELVYELKAH